MSPGPPERMNAPASNLYKSYPAARAEPRVGTRAFGECLLIFRRVGERESSLPSDFCFLAGGSSDEVDASVSSSDPKPRFVPLGSSLLDLRTGEDAGVAGPDERPPNEEDA